MRQATPLSLTVLLAVILIAAMTAPLLGATLGSDHTKKLETFPVYKSAIPWIKCSVCSEMVAEAYVQVERLRGDIIKKERLSTSPTPTKKEKASIDAALKKLLREEDIIEQVVEVICNPLSKSGWWIRELDLVKYQLEEESDNHQGGGKGENSKVSPLPTRITLEALPYLSTCRSDCNTVSEACGAILDGDAAENLSGMLYLFKLTKNKMQRSVCQSDCKAYKRLDARWQNEMQLFSSTNGNNNNNKKVKYTPGDPLGPLPEAFYIEGPPTEVPEKELEIEEMMDRMERNKVAGSPKMEVYDRTTMLKMQKAMAMGNRDEVAEYEPSVDDLSEEEFKMLQQMYKEEKGAELGLDDHYDASHKPKSTNAHPSDPTLPTSPLTQHATSPSDTAAASPTNKEVLKSILNGGDETTRKALEAAMAQIDHMDGPKRSEDEKLDILLQLLENEENERSANTEL